MKDAWTSCGVRPEISWQACSVGTATRSMCRRAASSTTAGSNPRQAPAREPLKQSRSGWSRSVRWTTTSRMSDSHRAVPNLTATQEPEVASGWLVPFSDCCRHFDVPQAVNGFMV